MSQYAYLSTIDPEFAEIADSLGPPPDAEEDAENDIHAMRVSGALLNAWYPGSTFPSGMYQYRPLIAYAQVCRYSG